MRNKTILVIEDERPLVRVIKTKLEKNDFDVVSARTVAQGLDYLEEIKDVAAIWLDHYLMGGETGLDFVVKLKEKNSNWSDIPIFVVSNTASNNNVQSYLELGVTNYRVKADYRLDQITNEIKSFLNK